MTEKLPDQLRDQLAAGVRRHRGRTAIRRFWAITTPVPAIASGARFHEVGITPRRYEPREFTELLKLGIGLTDVCKLGVGMDHQALKFPVDIAAFREKMLIYRPDTIAFTSKKAASLF